MYHSEVQAVLIKEKLAILHDDCAVLRIQCLGLGSFNALKVYLNLKGLNGISYLWLCGCRSQSFFACLICFAFGFLPLVRDSSEVCNT